MIAEKHGIDIGAGIGFNAALLFVLSILSFSCGDGNCIAEGETYSAKAGEARCCEGLVFLDSVGPSEDGSGIDGLPAGCLPDGPPDIKQCLPCGNGVCDPDEDYCNCPDDCTQGQ